MKKMALLGLAAMCVVTAFASHPAQAFIETPIVVQDDGTDNSGTLSAAGPGKLTGTSLENACQQFTLSTKEDVFQWLNWLRGCGAITAAQAEVYAPGYGLVETAWIAAKNAQLRDPTITNEARLERQLAAFASVESNTWTYPVFVDKTSAGVQGADPNAPSPVYTPHFFEWLRYYKVSRGRLQSLLQDEQMGCFKDPSSPDVHIASGKRDVALGGACTAKGVIRKMLIDNPLVIADPKNIRCRSEDVLWEDAGGYFRNIADNRNNWSYGCHHISKRMYDGLYGNADATAAELKFYISYARDNTAAPECDPSDRNPKTAKTWTNCFPVWTPEGDGASAPTQKDTTTGKYTACALPDPVQPFTSCQFGCYSPEQRILFSDGYHAIKDAFDAGRLDVVTLSPGATFEKLQTMNNHVENYIADGVAQEQEIVTIVMESGITLRLTPTHPMLAEDGTIRAVKEFQPGERLIRSDGSFDAIGSLATARETVRVYNLNPTTKDDTSNVLFVEGYLTASHRYQQPEVLRSQRQMLRHSLPTNHVR